MVTTANAGDRNNMRLGRKPHGPMLHAGQLRLNKRLKRPRHSISWLRRTSHKSSLKPAVVPSAGAASPVAHIASELTAVAPSIEANSPVIDAASLPPDAEDLDMFVTVASAELADRLRGPLMTFLQSAAGGKLSPNATTTAINRISQCMEWVYHHCQQDSGQAPTTVMSIASSSRQLFHWYINTIGSHPHLLEEYVNYQLTVIQRGPSTILNHLDALVQCYNFLVYDGRLGDQLEPVIATEVFQTRFPFYNQRCRRTLKKQLKQYKYVIS